MLLLGSANRCKKDFGQLPRNRSFQWCAFVHRRTVGSAPIVAIDDLKNEKLVLFDPAKAQVDAAQLKDSSWEGEHLPSFYFCESAEAVVVLVESGLGISILPDLFIPPDLSIARIPIKGVEPVSLGIYYKSVQGNAPLKDLIQIMREQYKDHDILADRAKALLTVKRESFIFILMRNEALLQRDF